MRKKSFAEVIASAQLLVKALTERGESLPAGVTVQMRDKLDAAHKKAVETNAEQEKLKAQLKEKTAELEKHLSKTEETYAMLKKYIKIGEPQERWREFGFEDKR
ncbi:membrane-binding protein [Capnocytophaga sp.]|uniref:membrane-binding protein n=1 Tax=Capnocytophaga sp. TaxID=44737 RepID=UPI0026DC8459|nr:membrane-binding protein [Capnocytophaga sp.]MDO5104992.1 membrane-binding protein [Capnocytophaga sp.]